MTEEQTEEERRLTRLVADQGAQIARLTQTLAVRELIIKELRYEVSEERAAVVAWLQNLGTWCVVCEASAKEHAACIERGEHRREEEK